MNALVLKLWERARRRRVTIRLLQAAVLRSLRRALQPCLMPARYTMQFCSAYVSFLLMRCMNEVNRFVCAAARGFCVLAAASRLVLKARAPRHCYPDCGRVSIRACEGNDRIARNHRPGGRGGVQTVIPARLVSRTRLWVALMRSVTAAAIRRRVRGYKRLPAADTISRN